MANQIKYQVGFVTDKTGLKELEQALQTIIRMGNDVGNEMDKGLQDAAVTAKQLMNILNKSYNKDLGTINVTKFNKELNNSSISVSQLQSNLSKAGAVGINAYNKLGSSILSTNIQLKESNKLLDDLATSMANTVKWGITSSIFNTVTNAIQKAYNYSVNLNTSLNDIRIVTGKSADEMNRFAEQANTAAKNLGTSTLDYTNAALIYYQQGLDATESAARAETTLKAANVTGQTGQEVSEQLTAVWNGYKVSAEETELYVDKLAAVAASTASNLEELSTGMSKVASAANSAGVDIDQLNGILSTVISVTREAPETIGSAFKTIFARLGDLALNGKDEYGVSLGKVSGQLHELGIEILDQKGEMRDMGDIIEDTAAKWQTWTRAQKQAAAVAMGGKMQYSRLIALFDNWNKYEDALNVSKNALGTLQKQNDIYLESTTAKLKTLKATWQDLYAGLINDDELNGGIDSLTNLVQIFDNFIDSFGGGIKSITAFGAIVANIFNKQIGTAIANAQLNQQKYQQNLDLLERKKEFIAAGTLQSKASSIQGAGEQANYETQILYAKKIQEAQKGISSEQYNQLTNLQQQIGQLEQEAVIIEKTAENELKKSIAATEYNNILEQSKNNIQILGEQEKMRLENAESQNIAMQQAAEEVAFILKYQNLLTSESEEQLQFADALKVLIGEQTNKYQKLLNMVTQDTTAMELDEETKKNVLNLVKKIVEENKKDLDIEKEKSNAVSRYIQAKNEANKKRQQKNILDMDFNDSMDKAINSEAIITKVTAITSSLSTLAMSWSSLNMLIQTWNDDSASFGDKVMQTLMTSGMVIPSLISSISKLGSTMGITSGIFDVLNAKKEANLALQQAGLATNSKEIASQAAKDAELTKSLILEQILNREHEKGNLLNIQSIAGLDGSAAASALKTAATKQEIAALIAAEKAQKAYNASILANPWILIAAGVVAAIGAVVAITAKVAEEQKKYREETIKTADTNMKKLEAEEKLYNSYIDVYDQYKNGKKSKEELIKVTDDLVDLLGEERINVAKLTGDYESLNAEILKAKTTSAKKGLESAENKRGAAETNLKVNMGKAGGFWDSESTIKLDAGFTGQDEDKQARSIIENVMQEKGLKTYTDTTWMDNKLYLYAKGNSTQDLVELYDAAVEARDKIQNEIENENDSEYFMNLNKWIKAIEEDITTYKDALNEIAQYSSQIEASKIDFSSVTDIGDMQKKREELEKYLQQLEAFKNKAPEEIRDVANQYISETSTQAKETIARLNVIDDLAKKYGEEAREQLIEALKDVPNEDLQYVLNVNEQESIENLDEFIQKAKLRANKVSSEAVINNVNFIQDDLAQGKTWDPDKKADKEKIDALNALEKKYEELGQIQDKTSHKYLQALRNIREQEETNIMEALKSEKELAEERAKNDINNIKKYDELTEEQREAARNNKDDENYEIVMNIEANLDDFDDAMKEIKDADYSIKLRIDADLASDVDNAFGLADELERLKSYVHDDLTYTFDEAQKMIAAGYGEIFTNAQETAENTIQVNKDVLNAYIDDKQAEIETDKEAKIAQLENQKILLQAQRQALVAKLGALQEAANAENEVDAATALQKAQNSEKEYQDATKALNAKLKDEADGATDTEKINSDLFNNLSGMYETNSLNQQQAEVDATNTQAREIQTRINNAKQLYNSYVSVGNAVKESATGPVISGFNAGNTAGGGGINVTGSTATEGKTHEATTITPQSLRDSGLFDDNGATEQYKKTIDALIKQTKSQINGIDAQIGAADAGIAALRTAWNSLDRAQADARPGGSKKNGGGGSKNEPDTMDKVEDEKDRYHDIDIILKQISTDLDRLDKQKEKLFGKGLIDNLNKQLSTLDKQINATNEKIRIARGEAAELRNALSAYGASFNADGTLANYTQVYTTQLNYVNSLITQYNSMSKEAQDAFKDTVEGAKKNFDKFVEDINKYDALVSDTIPGLEDDIQDAIDKQIEIKIEEFTMEIEIRLDMSEAERDWNEFKRKVIDGIKDTDILGNARARLKDFNSYYNSENTGEVQSLMKQVSNTQAQLEQMDRTGWSDFYGDNRAKGLEDLKSYNDQLMKSMEDVEDLIEEIKKSYLDMMDEAADKFQDQVDMYEQVKDIIDHDMNIIKLVYGEDSYADLEKYYQMQEDNNNKQLDFLRQQKDFWYAQMQTLEQGSEEWEKAKENWMDAVSEWNSKVEEAVENIQDKYLNAINKIFDELNNKVTSGAGLDYVSDEWELINQNADQYLDTINSLYGIQSLENKYLDAIDQTDNLSAQRKLNDLMNEELNALREKDKLTQYDIDRANMKYEIALKQIALEEAQQNKSTMRLRRDSQGNYTYQYVADNDQVGQIQDELDALKNQLYNFDLEHYRDNLDQVLKIYQEFQEKMKEAAQINDPEERAETELLLQEQYGELINGLVEQNETIKLNLHESAFTELADLYNTDLNNFQSLTSEEQEVLLGQMIPQWDSGIQHMADTFAGEGGFIPTCKDAMEQLNAATETYEQDLNQVQQAAGQDFGDVQRGIDDTKTKTEELIQDNGVLIQTYQDQLNAIQNVINELQSLCSQYNAVKIAAQQAAEAAYNYWRAVNGEAANAAGNNVSGGNSNSGSSGSNSRSSNNSSSGSGGAGSVGGDGATVGNQITYSGSYYYDSFGTKPSGSKYSGVADGVTIDIVNNNPYGIHIKSSDGRYPDLGWIKRNQVTRWNTGGYTGDWGDDSGRLAILDRKELILNKDDTANMLNILQLTRDFMNSMNNVLLSRMINSVNGAPNTGMGMVNEDTLEQNVHIDATFPNVKDAREVEEALNNLVNVASQRIGRNTKR